MDNSQTKTYTIFNTIEINLINFNEVLETSAETLRKSIDGTETFVKWYGNIPFSVQSLTTKKGLYTNNEILQILKGEEWTYTENFI